MTLLRAVLLSDAVQILTLCVLIINSIALWLHLRDHEKWLGRELEELRHIARAGSR